MKRGGGRVVLKIISWKVKHCVKTERLKRTLHVKGTLTVGRSIKCGVLGGHGQK